MREQPAQFNAAPCIKSCSGIDKHQLYPWPVLLWIVVNSNPRRPTQLPASQIGKNFVVPRELLSLGQIGRGALDSRGELGREQCP
jgi:hypothetical protein